MDSDQLLSDHSGHLVAIVPNSIQLRQSEVYPKETGAWCIIPIKEGTLLGPYKGKVVLEKDLKDVDYRYAWQIYDERSNRLLHALDATRLSDGNWMRFVNCARYFEEQNILAVQAGMEIYYKAIKDIPVGEELLTWFSMNKRKRRRKPDQTDAALVKKASGQINTLDDMMPKVKKRQKKPTLKGVEPTSESIGTKLKPNQKLSPLDKMVPVPVSADNIKLNTSQLESSKIGSPNVGKALKTDGARRGTRRKKCKVFTDSVLIGEGRIIKRQLKKAMKRYKKSELDNKTKTKMEPNASAQEQTVKSEANEIAMTKESDSKDGIADSEMKESKLGDRVEAEVCYRYTLTPDQRGTDASGVPLFMCDVCDVDYRHSFSLKRHYLRCHINYKYLSNHDVMNCMINLKSQTIASDNSDSPGTKAFPGKRKRSLSKATAKNGVNIKGDVTAPGETVPTSMKHMDGRPGLFWCNICYNLFDHLNDLKMHVALHTAEEKPSEYLYSCSKCEQQFSSKETLLDHVCQTKPVNVPERKTSTFPCLNCGKPFTAKVNLRQHMLVHESARHRCKYCGLRYKKPKPLRIHMRKVHKEKFYKCPGCRKWFTCIKRFRVHKKLLKCKDAVMRAKGQLKIRTTAQKGITGNSPLSKKSIIQQYMSPRKFLSKRIELNEVDTSQSKESILVPRRHSPKTKSFKKLCPAVFGLTKSKPCVVCPLCKVQVNGPFSSCTHKRNLDHSDDPMESFLDESRNEGTSTVNECTPDFFANVAYNIADNLNMFIDGKCDALTTFAKHIQIEDYTSIFTCPQMEQQQLSLSKYNFPDGFPSLCSFSQEAVVSEPLESGNRYEVELLPLDLSANTVDVSEQLETCNESLTKAVALEQNPDRNGEQREDISTLSFKDDAVCCNAWKENNFSVEKSENNEIENTTSKHEDGFNKIETMRAGRFDCALDCTLKTMNATSFDITCIRNEHETEKHLPLQADIGHDVRQYPEKATEESPQSVVKEIIDDILNNIPDEIPRWSSSNIEWDAMSLSQVLAHKCTNIEKDLPFPYYEDISDASPSIPDDFPSSEMQNNEEEIPPPLTLMVENTKSSSCELDLLSDEDCRSPPLLCMMFPKLERETVALNSTSNSCVEEINIPDSVHSSLRAAERNEPEIGTNSIEECEITEMNSHDADDGQAVVMSQKPSSSVSNFESTNFESEEPLNLVCFDKKERLMSCSHNSQANTEAESSMLDLKVSATKDQELSTNVDEKKTFLSCSNDTCVKTEEKRSMLEPNASVPKDQELSTNVDSITNVEQSTDWCLISNCIKQFDEIAFGKQGELIYVCDVCARQFQTHIGLLKHQGRKHPSIKCKYLLVEQGHHINELHFPSASAVGVLSQSSIANTSIQNVDKYVCTKCGVQFCSLSRLHVHIISCAPKSDKPLVIGDVKPTEVKLKKKMRDIQSGKGKIRFRLRDLSGYKSTLFKESSKEPNNKIMINRKRSAEAVPEIDNKKMKGRSYDLPYNPKKHIRRRDMTEVLERQKCGGCGLKFKTISLLERHIRKCSEKDRLRAVKPITSPRYNEKHSKMKHVCRYCHREFTYLKSIMNHYKEFCSVRRVLEQEGKLTASNLKDEAMIAAIVNSQEEQPQTVAPTSVDAEADGQGRLQKGWLKGRKRRWRKKNHSWTYIKKKKDVENKGKTSPVKEQPTGVVVEVNVKSELSDNNVKPEIVLPENNGVDLQSDKQDEQVNVSIKNEILSNDRHENVDMNGSSENHEEQISSEITDDNTHEKNICLTDGKISDDKPITFIKREPGIVLSTVDLLDSVDPSKEKCAPQIKDKPSLSLHQCSQHGEIAAQTLLVDSPDSDISR